MRNCQYPVSINARDDEKVNLVVGFWWQYSTRPVAQRKRHSKRRLVQIVKALTIESPGVIRQGDGRGASAGSFLDAAILVGSGRTSRELLLPRSHLTRCIRILGRLGLLDASVLHLRESRPPSSGGLLIDQAPQHFTCVIYLNLENERLLLWKEGEWFPEYELKEMSIFLLPAQILTFMVQPTLLHTLAFPRSQRGRRNGSTLPLPLVHHSYIGVLNFEVTFWILNRMYFRKIISATSTSILEREKTVWKPC